MEKFTIQQQYTEYLTRVGLKEAKLPALQNREMKRAFFAGISQTVVLFRDELSLLPEDEAVTALYDIQKQLKNFWAAELSSN